MKALAEFGAWIETAREMVCFRLKESDPTMPETWSALVHKVKQRADLQQQVFRVVKELFGLSDTEWLLLSSKFYNKRNGTFHPKTTPTKEALQMLNDLPSEFVAHREVFEKLVYAVDNLDGKEGFVI